jgi:hypothetical protein
VRNAHGARVSAWARQQSKKRKCVEREDAIKRLTRERDAARSQSVSLREEIIDTREEMVSVRDRLVFAERVHEVLRSEARRAHSGHFEATRRALKAYENDAQQERDSVGLFSTRTRCREPGHTRRREMADTNTTENPKTDGPSGDKEMMEVPINPGVDDGLCALCKEPGQDEDQRCHGCGYLVCDDCDVSSPMGPHLVVDHEAMADDDDAF